MAGAPSSVTRTGAYEPFELQVSRGQIPWHKSYTVFGYNPDVDTDLETVWPYGGLLSFPTNALQLSVSSDSVDDTSAGIGARSVYLEGLDSSHNTVSEIIVLNGQTAVTTVNSYIHVNNCYVLTTGSLNSAAGSIYFGTGTLTAGVPATVYDIIQFNYNSRITGSYTVPAGYTAYLVRGLFSAGQNSGAGPVNGRLMTRDQNDIRRTAAVTTVNNGVAEYGFNFPVAIPEKTTMEARAVGAGTNNSCSSMFNFVLIKNDAGTP